MAGCCQAPQLAAAERAPAPRARATARPVPCCALRAARSRAAAAFAPRRAHAARGVARAPPPPAAALGRGASAASSAAAGALVLVPAAVVLPHPDKVAKGGEDAHFVRVSPAGGILALADGVFQEYGIDASLYSRKLLRNVADAALLSDAEPATRGSCDPLALLSAAQSATREPGASTAVVVQLAGGDATLHAVSVGDSGFRVLRPTGAGAALQVAHASPAQQHEFDCPYQLGCAKFIADNDTADCGLRFTLPLHPGDLLLIASDGLYDNMHEEELLQVAAAALAEAPPGADGAGAAAAAARVAAALASAAAAHSRDASYDSPYAREARRDAETRRAAAGPMGMFTAALGRATGGEEKLPQGGKLDDITVIAALLLPAGAAALPAELAAAEAAAAAARAAAPSCVGDAQQEGRDVALFLTEAEEQAASAASAAADAAARRAAFLPAFDADVVAAMDAPALRKALAAKGLPTSGKLEALRARLAEVAA